MLKEEIDMTYTIVFQSNGVNLNWVSGLPSLEQARAHLKDWVQYAKPGDNFIITEGPNDHD